MPLGKEVKVMQCWRCKRYGHRTGDKECPFFIKGNQKLEQFRVVSTNAVVLLLVCLTLMMNNIAGEKKKSYRCGWMFGYFTEKPILQKENNKYLNWKSSRTSFNCHIRSIFTA
uniref:Uncharacterized protein n=1 Tax=Pavo cristatus TaxID=9049 RepID=A0A8C9FAV7_PAVCR